jgi:hypothetical protein
MESFTTASHANERLIQTIIDKLVHVSKSEGLDEHIINKVRNNLLTKYNAEGLRLLVVPSPVKRSPVSRTPKGNYKWEFHPEDNNFSWSADLKLGDHYFLKRNDDQSIIASISDFGVHELTKEDLIFLSSKGLVCKHVTI